MRPDVILGYALFDAEHTARLGEHPDLQEEYFKRARDILCMIREFRPKEERACLAEAIRWEHA